jgi:hypothetical protein
MTRPKCGNSGEGIAIRDGKIPPRFARVNRVGVNRANPGFDDG